MSNSNVEWERQFVTKYSETTAMKNGLRKTYYYDNECNHDKNVQELECPLCQSLFECCQKCYSDFCEDDVNVKDWNDLICPDCLEQCHKCHKFVCEDNGSRSDVYPFELYCATCAQELGICYDSPDEISARKAPKPNQKSKAKTTKKTLPEPYDDGNDNDDDDESYDSSEESTDGNSSDETSDEEN